MGKHEKLLTQVLSGTSDVNIPFDGLCGLLKYLGFEERFKGSHHISQKMILRKYLIYSLKVINQSLIRLNRFAM